MVKHLHRFLFGSDEEMMRANFQLTGTPYRQLIKLVLPSDFDMKVGKHYKVTINVEEIEAPPELTIKLKPRHNPVKRQTAK